MSTSTEKEKRETFWTKTEKETSKEIYGCEILVENGSPADVMTKDAPTDASMVKSIKILREVRELSCLICIMISLPV